MKHFIQSICSIILALFLAGCGASESQPKYVGEVSRNAEKEALENIQLYMEDTDIATDADEVVFYISNHGDEEFLYDSEWFLEVLYEDVWHSVPIKLPDDVPGNGNIGFSQVATILRPGKTNKKILTFYIYNYQFKSGTYRWVQYVGAEDKIISVEFQMVE